MSIFKKLIMAQLLCAGMWLSAADAPVSAPATQTPVKVKAPAKPEKSECIYICFYWGMPSNADQLGVDGIKVGAPISYGSALVTGLEASVLCSNSDYVDGVQCSIISNVSKIVNGLQFGIINVVEECNGVQLGIYNDASEKSFQIGILNHNKNSSFLPWFPIVNF